MDRPKVGDRAPDALVEAMDGSLVPLSTMWSEGPLVLVFLRHYG
jgi:hypothetical protein